MFHKSLAQWVDFKRTGHWPDTAIVVLVDKELEVYCKELEAVFVKKAH